MRSLEIGGVQKVVLDLLKNISVEKFDTSLIVNLYQGELRDQVPKNIRLIKICKGKEDFSKNYFLLKLQLLIRRLKIHVLNNFPLLLRFFYIKDSYDIEIACSRIDGKSVLRRNLKSKKKIVWIHTNIPSPLDNDGGDSYLRQIEQFDYIISCSKNILDKIRARSNKKLKGYVFHNIIHPEEIKLKAKEDVTTLESFNEFLFCSIGRLTPFKGYDLLIHVHHRLINEGLKHKIIVIGEGFALVDLRKLLKKFELEDSFKFLGHKDNPYSYLSISDSFVLPSQSEAYPLVIKEALILEKPIIATNVGGINEIVDDGIDGLLIDYNKEELYNAMKDMLINQKLFAKLKNGAKNALNKFEDNNYQELENKLIELLD